MTQNILHLGSISPLVLFCFYFLFCIFCRETATCSLENLTCISFNKILTVCVCVRELQTLCGFDEFVTFCHIHFESCILSKELKNSVLCLVVEKKSGTYARNWPHYPFLGVCKCKFHFLETKFVSYKSMCCCFFM